VEENQNEKGESHAELGEASAEKSKNLPAVIAIPDGMQLIEVEKLRKIVDMAKAFQQLAVSEHNRAEILQGDAQQIVNAFVTTMEESGLMELFDGKGDVDMWEMILKMTKMIKKIYRQRNDPDNAFRKAGSTFIDFLKKYGNPENFDENGQFKLPQK